jgi:hypothetical protein
MSLISNVAANRPHMSGKSSVVIAKGQAACESNSRLCDYVNPMPCTTQEHAALLGSSYRLFNHTYSQNKPTTTIATTNIVRSVLFIFYCTSGPGLSMIGPKTEANVRILALLKIGGGGGNRIPNVSTCHIVIFSVQKLSLPPRLLPFPRH